MTRGGLSTLKIFKIESRLKYLKISDTDNVKLEKNVRLMTCKFQ